MRVIYLAIGGSTAGVMKKLVDKTKYIKAEGIDIELASTTFTPQNQKINEYISIPVDSRISKFLGSKRIWWRLSVFIEQWEIYRAVNNFLKSRDFDLIFFRYPVADLFLWRLSATYQNKIVYEHNTIELKELGLRKAESIWFKYFYYSEKWFGPSVKRMAKGLVGVTNEITEWQVYQTKGTVPHVTISNGIDVDRLKIRADNPFNGAALNLLFLAGSESPWHGIDKLINSINSYAGDCNLHCYIAGKVNTETKEKIEASHRITLLSFQHGKELDDLVDLCHIGIGSLGMANFLSEACPLKTREYWSRGLPFVVGYNDVDLLEHHDMKSFCLHLDNNDSDYFRIEDVLAFADRVHKIPAVSLKMRDLALNYIHSKVKAKQYVSFFNLLLT